MIPSTNILMQSYPPRALDKRLQEDYTKDEGEVPKVELSYWRGVTLASQGSFSRKLSSFMYFGMGVSLAIRGV